MFKNFSLIAILVMTSLSSFAQETDSNDKPSKFGFTAGYMYNSLNVDYEGYLFYGDDPTNTVGGDGYYAGLTYDTELGGDFGLTSELTYSIAGTKNIRLATLLKYRLFDSNFHFTMGPELNYLMRGVITKETGLGDYGNDLGLDLTGGLEYDINNRVSLYGRYSYELTDRYKGKQFENRQSGGFQTLRFGIKFKF
ncbi:PorT family protein [Gramella sp. BOM4]|nr:PorT family protein [Christiangramia bathymodioli]